MLKKPIIYIVAGLMLGLAGCGGGSNTISENGSTTIQPLAEKLAAVFMADNPEVVISIAGGGSSVGVQSAASGVVDIGACSRELMSAEKGAVVEHLLARDGVAIILHPSNPMADLSLEQIRAVFTGEITSWSELGGPDEDIHVVAREEGSGTREAFQLLVMGTSAQITSTAILQSSNGALRTTVAGDPDAIGFLSFGYMDASIKAVSVGGVAPTVDNAQSGAYPVVRPLLFLTKAQPRGNVKDFIDFCLSDAGQEIVAAEGYLPINGK
jgi:phosphate transport system substrate-binding protein